MSQYSPPTYHTQTKTPSIIHRHLLQTNPKSHPPTSPQYHNNQTFTHTTNTFIHDQQPPSRNKPRLQQPPKTLTNLTSKIEMRAPPKLTTLQTQIQNKPGNISHMSCTRCRRAPETAKHFLLRCPSISRPRISWGITSLKDLWTRPTAAGGFINEVWAPQHRVGRGGEGKKKKKQKNIK